LGLLYVGAILDKNGYDVKYVDLSTMNISKAINNIPLADVHMFTMTSALYDIVRDILKWYKDGYKAYKVVGGVHPSIFPEETMYINTECVVSGEGESVVDYIVKKRPKGIVYGRLVTDLDSLPFPARHLMDRDTLRTKRGIHDDIFYKDGAVTTMIATRGCPYSCKFCCKITQTKAVRFRSALNVYDEIMDLKEKYDIHHIRFADDMFTLKRKFVFDLCKLLKDTNTYWSGITRVDTLDKTLLERMYEAGCRELEIGIESGSNRILRLMKKKTTVEENIQGVKLIKDSGIMAKVLLMYDYPDETPYDTGLTKKFMMKAQPDKWTLSKFTLIPGSQLWNERLDLRERYKGRWFFQSGEDKTELREWLESNIWRKEPKRIPEDRIKRYKPKDVNKHEQGN
jgi:radical SAM superfamily enzyme YgiQ (UPF0313 family)